MANTDWAAYVNAYGDLKTAWTSIQTGSGSDWDYWNPQGATTIADFGRIHWGSSGESEGRSLTGAPTTAYPDTQEAETPQPGTTPTTPTTPETPFGETPTGDWTAPAPIADLVLPDAPTFPTTADEPDEDTDDEVSGATTVLASLPTVTAPTINTPAQRTLNPQELVEWRMAQMMKVTNPYTAQAITNAKQFAAQGGMLNTSIAASAGVDAAIKSILPIAQQDATTLFSQSIENQRAVNDFLMQDFLTKSEFRLTDFGAKVTTYNTALQRYHEKNESAITRWWQKEQNKLDRELQVWRDKYDAQLKKWLADKKISVDEVAGIKDCVQSALSRWQSSVSAVDAAYIKGDISVEAYNQAVTNLQQMRDHEVSACRQ